jgi:cell wall assembly regulator SMI1
VTEFPYLGLGPENRKGSGRTADEIARAEEALGYRLPSDYHDLLAWADGWEGWIGEA